MNRQKSMFTLSAHDGFDSRHHGAISFPVYNNSLFAFTNYNEFLNAFEDPTGPYVYTRVNNPTVEQLEKKLALLEGGGEGEMLFFR